MREIFIRRSVRKFQQKPIEKEKITQILKAAMQAPSAGNQQPWKFLVIQDPERKASLKAVSKSASMVEEAGLAIVLLMDTRDLKKGEMAPQDMSAAMQNLLLEVVSLGLGAVWIGVYPTESRVSAARAVLNLPEFLVPFSIAAIGYPEKEEANYFLDRFDVERIYFEEV